jgi:hypothetical protein
MTTGEHITLTLTAFFAVADGELGGVSNTSSSAAKVVPFSMMLQAIRKHHERGAKAFCGYDFILSIPYFG